MELQSNLITQAASERRNYETASFSIPLSPQGKRNYGKCIHAEGFFVSSTMQGIIAKIEFSALARFAEVAAKILPPENSI